MTTERAPRRRVAPALSSAIFALVAAAWIQPAISATGTHARCDQAIDGPPLSVSDDGRMALRVLGRTANTVGSSEQTSPRETDSEPAPAPVATRLESRVDALLRRTARETDPGRLLPEQSGDEGMPLVADKVEEVEEPPRMLDSEQTEAAVERPGYPDDDLVRSLQRQMYRTDI